MRSKHLPWWMFIVWCLAIVIWLGAVLSAECHR